MPAEAVPPAPLALGHDEEEGVAPPLGLPEEEGLVATEPEAPPPGEGVGTWERAEEGEFSSCGEGEARVVEVAAEDADGEPERVAPLDGEAPGVAVAGRADRVGAAPDAVPTGEEVAVREAPAEAVARGLSVAPPDAEPLPLDVAAEDAEGGEVREPRALPLPLGEALSRAEPEGLLPDCVAPAEGVVQAVAEGEGLPDTEGWGDAEGVFAPLLVAEADAEGDGAVESVALALPESAAEAEPPPAELDAPLLRVAAAAREREGAGEAESPAVGEGEAEGEGVPLGEAEAAGVPDPAAEGVDKGEAEGGAEGVAVRESPAPSDGVADAAVPAGEAVGERDAGAPVWEASVDAVAPADNDAVALCPLLCVCMGVAVAEKEGEALELGAALPVAPGCERVPPPLPVALRVSPRGLALPLSDGSSDTEGGDESDG